ncbi:MAG: CocE/NonD family hydrolase [Solirubrobacteraceae bacterium]
MRRLRERLLQGLALAWLTALFTAPAAQGADPEPFGHPCNEQNGVRFCPTADDSHRVPTFDEVPIDVDVTLPASGDGPWPTIVMLHGWGGDKKSFETDDEGGDGSVTWHYNNNFYAKQGFAVVNYSARGWGRSCGAKDSRDDPNCEHGYIRLADQRFEARDTQFLLGLLVDEGITKRTKIGVTGISYGGGQSNELALLRNRIRTPGGDFKAWRSEKGVGLSITAAFPRWPWSDLVASLLPNGRFLDSKKPDTGESRNPLGIALKTYTDGLYALGGTNNGYYCGEPPSESPCNNDQADITKWNARVQVGEPEDSEARAIADEIFHHHQAFGLPADRPAPLLSQSGWTDDLFPPRESLRMYNLLRASGKDIALQFGDLGHSRGENDPSTNKPLNDQGADFFRKLLLGEGSRPKPGSVTAFAQTCPPGGDGNGPFEAKSWNAIHPSSVTFSSSQTEEDQTAISNPQPDSRGLQYDPILSGDIIGGNSSCRESDDDPAQDVGTAVYRGASSGGFRMIGLPKVTAKISVTPDMQADDAQLDSRLWDVDPDTDKQILISRGAYRIKKGTDGEVTFQLWGNAWCFAPGHIPKLQLLGTDRPYLRPTTGPDATYAVHIASVKVTLPTASGDCGT